MKEFLRKCDHWVDENPKKTILGVVAAAATAVFGVWGYKKKREADADAKIRVRQNAVVCLSFELLGKRFVEMMDDERRIRRRPRGCSDDYYSDEYSTNDGDEYNSYGGVCLYRGRTSTELFSRTAHEDHEGWIVEGYMRVGMVNLLAAGAGAGKTTLMTQIALATDKGARPEFLPTNCCDSVKLRVVYYRLENFANELHGKYGDGKVLKESGIEWVLPEDLREKNVPGLVAHLKGVAGHLTGDALVCIDPATKLENYNHKDFIRGVEEAMEIAKTSSHAQLTIIASIHLDEIEDWKPINLTDIKGGDGAVQQAGSVTALRKERREREGYRFLQCMKEPKGHPQPFNGDVLVCKMVEELEGVKYLHLQYDSIVPESKALPEKPTKRQDDENDDCQPQTKKPSAEKWNQEIAGIVQEDYESGMTCKDIVADVYNKTAVEFSPDYMGKIIRKQPYYKSSR